MILRIFRVDSLDALKTVILSNMGEIGSKEVGVEENNNEGNSDYIAEIESSNESDSSDEHVPETPTGLDDPFNLGNGEDYNPNGCVEFRVGHGFRNRDTVLMAVKNYSI
ncbi:uncharacterized protein DS421_11g332960 [Arachis hypogaea]|nr:uncharacterized protein DS421_11g332960 [Arachis hypogaea]